MGHHVQLEACEREMSRSLTYTKNMMHEISTGSLDSSVLGRASLSRELDWKLYTLRLQIAYTLFSGVPQLGIRRIIRCLNEAHNLLIDANGGKRVITPILPFLHSRKALLCQPSTCTTWHLIGISSIRCFSRPAPRGKQARRV